MNAIEIKGCIANIRYIHCYKPTYQFIVNGQFCSYEGSIPLEIGDYVQVVGRPNELSYTNNMGERKTFKQITVTSLTRL